MAAAASSAGAQDVSREADLEGQLRAAELEAQAGDQHSVTAETNERLQGGEDEKQENVAAVLALHAGDEPKAAGMKALRWHQYALLVSISCLAPFSTDAYCQA